MRDLSVQRVLGVTLGLSLLGLTLGACSNTTSADGAARVQTSQVSYPTNTLSVQPVGYQVGAGVPEQQMAGRWYLNDEFERDCIIDLDVTPIDGIKRKAYSTRECSNDMSNLAGWDMNADGSAIRLYGTHGQVLGQLLREDGQLYKGTFTLTTEQVVTATLRPI